jgi:phosphoribosylformimino-5-aminoimidazole carboxamide ribotide isomerase
MTLTIVPSIDLRGGQVVRLQQGDFARQIDYDLDPFDVARSFARDGATIMHIVDLDGAKEGRAMQADLIGQIAREAGITVQAGGGVRERGDVLNLIRAGVHRVVVGTKAIADWNWFESLMHDPDIGASKLVLAIDAKDGVIATHGWTQSSTLTAVEVARRVNGTQLGALLYTDVARDGMLGGVNVEMTQSLARTTNIPVIASGGIGTIDHIHALLGRNIWGVILGRSLHDGRVKLTDAIDIGKQVKS